MKAVLVVLSGDAEYAQKALAQHYPEAFIELLPRSEIEDGSYASRLSGLRARRPNIFVVATERLGWQRGQDLFMLFGALAGAQTVVVIDAHGGFRKASRSELLRNSFATLARATTSGSSILRRAKRELRKLERAVELLPAPLPHARKSATGVDVTYLRATPGPGTQAGGAASHIKGVTQGLRELGAGVRIISNDAIAGIDEEEPTIIGPQPRGTTRAVFEIHNNAVFTSGAVPLIENDPPDFIYQRYARFGWAGVVASLRTQRPLFLEYNGSEVWVGRHWDHVGMLDLLSRYEHLNLRAADRVFVVSEVERRNLEHAGISCSKIIVNPNGVDTEVFRPDVGGEALRSTMEIRNGETLVGFVGTFGPWHGVQTLVAAIKLIPVSLPVRFLLVGSGSSHEEVRQLLTAEEQEGRVTFTGAVEHEQVPKFLDACDILVSPHVPLADGSEFFGSPTKIFEYMAMGKGIVASRLGQIGEVLQDGETALLVEPGNVQELSVAVMRLVESQPLREQLGANARRAAINRHTWKRNAENVLDAYQSWLDE